ncbi:MULTISPECIES: ATP-binding protein [unclassified Variovorax]|uniref:ATP-binding protein n=1 Tax=unclassified Variovorax TaxID=663243 RepID=UPI0025757AC0|nr:MULTISPECIES: ATP-binding protein [unclassified Variovorax]MDM0089920.1 GAF domain-containing protein [Variovorax sp. J22G40]MDM0148414.1 GAF domain-containing protein [Variovorax sp. J2P1-31]
MSTADLPINLDNCAREPIHIPGLIQSHGALFAFSAARAAVYVSANAAALLGPTAPAAGEILSPHHFAADADVHAALDELLALPDDGLPTSSEVRVNGQVFDLVVHGAAGVVIAEFELRPATADVMADFALKAHRAMERIKRQNSVAGLMAFAVRAVRQLTGFDRVMGYRFRHDDSGDVVAEDRIETLEPFLGRRYPASDIPAQARRLYVVNTLRLIADVHAAPVPVQPAPGVTDALDMSHCVLRSVSPIHIEYLQNMGVGASMSISIVVNGQLWGMLACHHMAPLQVPYSVRMACDVLAQILAANVQSLMARDHARRSAEAADLRTRLIEAALHSDDTATALAAMGPDLAAAFQAHAVVIAEASKLHIEGEVPHDVAVQLIQWLDAAQAPVGQMLATPSLRQLAPALADAAGVWCGMLALSFDPDAHGWLVLLRKEQLETIQWGGHPEKTYRIGPLGPRLTPRGSFDVWRETVRDTSVPWDADDTAFGRRLLDELLRARSAHVAEVARGRSELMAMLGHDLRDPLHSIAMAARLLGKEAEAEGRSVTSTGGRMGQRIQASSTRMARMISQVLDMSRLQTGGGLDIHRTEVDLTGLLDDLLDEMRTAHPGVQLIREAPPRLLAQVDGDRMAQVFSNLISNARQHGAPGESIIVQLSHQAGQATLDVSNVSPPIAPELASQLFNAFKRREQPNPRNRNGLGLGLYIAQAVVRAHGGHIGYAHAEPFVVFSVRFPLAPA